MVITTSTLLSYFKALKGRVRITQGAALRYESDYQSKALEGCNHMPPVRAILHIHLKQTGLSPCLVKCSPFRAMPSHSRLRQTGLHPVLS